MVFPQNKLNYIIKIHLSGNHHPIVVERFACPNEPGSSVVRSHVLLVGSPKANWSRVRGQTIYDPDLGGRGWFRGCEMSPLLGGRNRSWCGRLSVNGWIRWGLPSCTALTLDPNSWIGAGHYSSPELPKMWGAGRVCGLLGGPGKGSARGSSGRLHGLIGRLQCTCRQWRRYLEVWDWEERPPWSEPGWCSIIRFLC